MAHVTSWTLLSGEVAIVLRDRALIHGRTKVRRIAEVFRKGVVSEKTQTVGVPAAYVHISRVIPALGRVFQQVNRAYREGLALNDSVCAAGNQHRVGDEAQRLEGAPRAKRSRTWRRIIDQVGALQVETAGSEIADFECSARSESLFDLRVPLLNVLGGSVGIEGSKAHRGSGQCAFTKYGSAEIKRIRQQGSGRREVVSLLRLR